MFLYFLFLKDGSDREDNMDSRTRHFEYGFDDDIDGDLKRVYCQLFGGTNIVCCNNVVDTVVYVILSTSLTHSYQCRVCTSSFSNVCTILCYQTKTSVLLILRLVQRSTGLLYVGHSYR